MKRPYVLPLILLAACSGSGNGPIVDPPTVVNQSPGGVWYGTRPNGTPIVVLINEAGDLRIIDEFGNQGFGQMVVTNGTEISASYQVAPRFGRTLIDGSDSWACSLTGTLQERQSINYTLSCTTSLGGQIGGEIALTFDAVYESGSSIARIAGTYETSLGNVLTIDVNGALFVQDINSGSVTKTIDLG